MIIRFDEIEPLDRGGGVRTLPLVTARSRPGTPITTGISVYPPGTGAPLHSHNCDEQVTLIGGLADVEIAGVVRPLDPHDTTYIPQGIEHAFRNRGEDLMTILWIYCSDHVTRTLSASGETVEHLSERDRMG
jgi:oxalate decarboxylase/phosphoglucose isomerase-like protein (cupin superfamily)